jgi:TonB family protein
LFSQPVLVALDNGQDVVYAAASGWDRVYLYWMFRNFRSLRQNVLSPRQRQFIGTLYGNGSTDAQELHAAFVVGTVENFWPSSLVTTSSSVRARKSFTGEKQSPNVPRLESKPSYARFAINRMVLKVGTAALVIAIAILAWHQLGAQPVADSSSPAATHSSSDGSPALVQASNQAAALPVSNPAADSPVTPTDHVGTAAPAVQRSEAPPADSVQQPIASPRALASVSKHELGASPAVVHHLAAAAPKIYEAASDQPRVQISGRPRKLVYPVCPETQARGKVSLQAVVRYDGAVSRVRVLTGDRALAAAAVEAVRQWRYEPFSGAAPLLERETNITISFISNEVVAVSFPSSAPLSR